MAQAVVGDDVFGEDPTINSLQERVAELFGAEASLFVPTGSMGNLVSLRAMAGPGDEVICHEWAHVIHYEVGALAALGGIQPRPLRGRRGVLNPDDVASAIKGSDKYTFPHTKVIALENTHNLAGGTVYPIDDIAAIRKVADEYGLKVYLDGARIFNAAIASGVSLEDYMSLVDGLSFCFSKGLGCPVGSMVVGSSEFVIRAHRLRKMQGGGMRQAGVLAAPCHVALDSMIERLAEDHSNAKRLAEGIGEMREGVAHPENVETNMVLVQPEPFGFTPQQFVDEIGAKGVRAAAYMRGNVRFVTYNGISRDDVEYALAQIASVVKR